MARFIKHFLLYFLFGMVLLTVMFLLGPNKSMFLPGWVVSKLQPQAFPAFAAGVAGLAALFAVVMALSDGRKPKRD